MANTLIQLKRSAVAGKTPNTTTLSIGELAINLTDKKLFSSDGTAVFEMNANNANNSSYLGSTAAANFVQNTDSRTLSGNLIFSGANNNFSGKVTAQANLVVASTGEFIIENGAGINANGSYGIAGYVLATNASSVYWTPLVSAANADAQYSWTNTQTFSNTITFSSITTVGSGGANIVSNTTAILLQSNSTVNTIITPTSLTVSNTTAVPLIANSSGLYHTGEVNAAILSTAGVLANSTGFFPTSNTISLGNTTARWVIVANSLTLTGGSTLAGFTTITSSVGFTGTTTNINATSQTSGGIHFGGAQAIGPINIGVSTNNQTVNVATGATISGNVKTLNIGTSGAAGSQTNITVGSSLSNTLITVNANNTNFSGIVNASAFTTTGNANAAVFYAGANVYINATAAFVSSNSTVNTVITDTSITQSNTTAVPLIANSSGVYHTGTINAASHTVGATFTANATLVNTAAINVTGQVNTATLYAATSANLAGTTTLANTLGIFTTGTVNAASFSVGTIFTANSTLVDMGNVNINTTSMYITTNSTVNTVITATSITQSNTTATPFVANVTGLYHTGIVNATTLQATATFTANATLVNAAAINITGQVNTATLYATTSVNVGALVQTNTTAQLIASNSTVNTIITPTSFTQANTTATPFVANVTGLYHTGTVNAATLQATATFTANSTLVNAAAINITGQVNTATLYATTSANLAGTTTLANTLGIFTTGTVNAASFSVGTAFTANSTLVNAAAVSIIAGNTTSAPLRLTTGTVTTTVSNGSIEYTDPTFYATPTNSRRAAIATPYLWVQGLSVARTAQIAAQGIFGAAGTSTLAINLGVGRYRYALRARYSSTAVATNFQYALGGTATLGLHSYNAVTKISITSSLTAGTTTAYSNAKTATFTGLDVISAASTAAASFFDIIIDGIIDVTAAGTVIFQQGQSAATAVLTLGIGSFIEIFPYGTGAALGAANTNIGGWA
ncbi:hypothetical protein UFOVP247_128 [uncultured Caudovirales phage]|uniref:Uncharacterized protein n=1 Tax=uncultured Caudovirales phage TaxID=2100421 RepID=A0A6J7WWS6_9CAUD|nr:hypothetical protein UFOVP247_128 [uncultured Caudovirales phage]